jgi:CRISPR-associated protein Csb1
MTKIAELTLDVLEQAVGGEAAAIRCLTRLQPAGGKGDKIFPPTYGVDKPELTRYAVERRRIEGVDVDTVLLDSVASQANRMEEALYSAWTDERISFPVISVDFSDEEGLADLDRITTLHAPHRIADALLRDSVDSDGRRFRDTEQGRAYTDASVRNAAALYQSCPTALIFGVWDSTGPRGGLGNKIQRALVSEIVGIGAISGAKTSSRIDPAGIQSNVPVYHRKGDRDDWTAEEGEAFVEKGKPAPFSRKGSEGKGKPSAINHSNVKPSIDVTAGGVTIDYALQTTVLSLPALRRLRFPVAGNGEALAGARRATAERRARTALAALALTAITELRSSGYDLRSRSFLIPEPGGPLVLELVPAEGGEPAQYSLSKEQAAKLLADASKLAADAGLPWQREPLTLKPAPKLSALIRESRKRAASGEAESADETK